MTLGSSLTAASGSPSQVQAPARWKERNPVSVTCAGAHGLDSDDSPSSPLWSAPPSGGETVTRMTPAARVKRHRDAPSGALSTDEHDDRRCRAIHRVVEPERAADTRRNRYPAWLD